MALDRLTKVDGGGISTTSDYRVGIITASKFIGPFDGTGGNFSGVVTATNGVFSGNVSAVDGNFSGNVTIGGTLTYEDVTNIDSVGIITAAKDIHVGAGISAVGVITGRYLNPSSVSTQNVIIGWEQSTRNVTGSWNVLIGRRAGESLTSAGSAVCIGANAGQLLGGTSGIFIGGQAGSKTTGSANLFIGNNAGQQTTSAGACTIIGHLAGIDNQGSNNTILGYYAGRGNSGVTDGAQNTFIGAASGFKIQGGDDNTGVGYYTLRELLGGNKNVAIGRQAGDALVSGNNNIIIGYQAEASTTTTSNEITLGDANINHVRIPGIGVSFNNTGGTQLGIITATELDISGDIDVDGHTNLDNVSISGVTTTTGFIESVGTSGRGAKLGGLLVGYDSLYATVQPITGDLLHLNYNAGTEVRIGAANTKVDLYVNGDVYPKASGNRDLGLTNRKWRNVYGTTFIGNGDFVDIDVDGHTNLDNVSIAGVTTFSGHLLPNADSTYDIGTNSVRVRNVYADTLYGNGANITNVDAATLDGVDGANYVRTDQNTTITSDLFIGGGGGGITVNAGSDIRFTNGDWTGNSTKIQHHGSYLFIQGGSNGIKFRDAGGTNRWIIDSSGHFLPDSVGSYNIGSTGAEIGDVYIADDKRLFFGSDQDFSIKHSGTNAFIDNDTGNLNIQSDTTYISNKSGGSIFAEFFNGGASKLRYAGGEKLATSDTGITVTGEVAATQDFPLFKPVLDFNFAAEKKLDPRFKFSRASMATFIDKKGIVQYAPDNQPRFDHHPTSGVSLGLLLEREQTNYQEYSALMSEANHKNNITVTDNFTISPDGTQNASKIVNASGSNAQTNIGWNGTSVANNSYGIWSIWVKSEETSCILQFYTNTYIGGNKRVNVELADGTTGGNVVASDWRWNVEKYPNKWWRVSWGGNGQGAAGGMYIGVVDSKSAARAATCGSATNKTWFAWGVQEEISTQSRIATSYIPTNGYAALRKGDRATMDGDDFDDFFDRFQGTIINEHSNALQSYGGGGSGWEFNNDQFQTNLINQTGSGYAANSYPGAFASVMGDRGSNGSGNGSGSDYMQAYGPNYAAGLNGPANDGNGRYPSNNVADYTRYYKTWTDAMSYDVTPSENILRTATGGASSYVGGNTQSISLANVSKFEFGNDAGDMGYSSFYGRIKRWVYYDKVLPLSQLETLTAQLPNSYL